MLDGNHEPPRADIKHEPADERRGVEAARPCVSLDEQSAAMHVVILLTIIAGLPRWPMIVVSSRATLAPEIEVSATSARHSRLKSSTTHRMRKRRPQMKL